MSEVSNSLKIFKPFVTKFTTYEDGIELIASRYIFPKENLQKALVIYSTEGECITIPTCMIIDRSQEKDEIFIKNYAENSGMLEELQKFKIIGPSLEEIPVGFLVVHRCKVLIPLRLWANSNNGDSNVAAI